jgi:hypothetical protein
MRTGEHYHILYVSKQKIKNGFSEEEYVATHYGRRWCFGRVSILAIRWMRIGNLHDPVGMVLEYPLGYGRRVSHRGHDQGFYGEEGKKE